MSIKIELEFIPVAERLPEESGDCLCLTEDSCVWSVMYFAFELSAFLWKDIKPVITHWAKLPDLSKASENNSRSEFKERILKEIAANREVRTLEEQRRDMFERVCMALITHQYGGLHSNELFFVAQQLTNKLIEQSDTFARGES